MGGYEFRPHLPSQDTKRVHIAGYRGSGIGEPPWPSVDQFWGRAGERSIDVFTQHGGWSEGRRQARDVGMPVTIHEDVGLE